MKIRSYRDLEVWQKAVALTVRCYELAALLPKAERFGLTSQLQRSAVSVAANITEGHGRRGLGEYLHHLGIARASLMELETHVIIGQRLAYLPSARANALLESSAEVARMLSGLVRSLERLRSSGERKASAPDTQHPTPGS